MGWEPFYDSPSLEHSEAQSLQLRSFNRNPRPWTLKLGPSTSWKISDHSTKPPASRSPKSYGPQTLNILCASKRCISNRSMDIHVSTCIYICVYIYVYILHIHRAKAHGQHPAKTPKVATTCDFVCVFSIRICT